MIRKTVKNLAKMLPRPIKSVLTSLGIEKLLNPFLHDKYECEISFQKQWAIQFKQNKNKVLEYWKDYRYLDQINSLCDINDKTKVLDVGCGISTVLHFVKGKRVGIDPLMNEYQNLYEYPDDIEVKKCFGENLSFPDEYFDVIFCTNVLDHIQNPKKALKEIHRALKADGKFVLTVEIFPEKTDRTKAHPHCFTRQYVDSLIQNKFEPILIKQSPWIGLKNYVNRVRQSRTKELIIVMEKA